MTLANDVVTDLATDSSDAYWVDASLYSTGFGFPWRAPCFWFTSAWIPAMIGAAKEVPPAPDQVLGAPLQRAPPSRVSESQNT